jgi:hypothetical protein
MDRIDFQDAWVKIVDIGFSDYNKLGRDQRVWFNVEPLTTDGIIDHYINSGAEHNADTIEDLEMLGHAEIADMLRQINKLFKNGKPPFEIVERNDEFVAFAERDGEIIDELDSRFWMLNESLEKSLLEHIIRTNIGTV